MNRITDEWSRSIPRDPVKNVRLRLKLLDDCEDNETLQSGVMSACEEDPIFWIIMFGMQSNPINLKHKQGPFIPRPYQEKGIRDMIRTLFIEGEDMGIEKSREEGASWGALFAFLWACLFHHDTHVVAVSHSEKAVDNGPADSKSLFWKARYILKHLPDWMTRGYIATKLAFEFPATNSGFTGEACTGRTTVGGRGQCLLDEFGKMMKADEIWSNTADVGPRLIISTHYATKEGAEFARLCDRPRFKKMRWHWSMNPEKSKGLYRVKEKGKEPELLDKDFDYTDYPFVLDGTPGGPFKGLRSEWYDKEEDRRGKRRDMALHLDMDRSGASSQFFDPMIIQDLRVQYGTHPRWEGSIQYDPEGKLLGITKRLKGPLRIWRPVDLYGRVVPGNFAIGADAAEGSNTTASCLSVIDITLCEKVAEFSSASLYAQDFAMIAMAVGWLFCDEDGNPAQICWETNGPSGSKFSKRLLDKQYPGQYRRMLLPPHCPTPTLSPLPGWNSSAKGKKDLLDDFREAVETRTKDNRPRLIIRSLMSLSEYPLFRFNRSTDALEHSGEVDAEDGSEVGDNHADMAMADAIAWLVCLGRGTGVRTIEIAKRVETGTNVWRDNYAKARGLVATGSSWVER